MKTPAMIGLLLHAVALGVPTWDLALHASLASLVAPAVAIAGACGGTLIRRALSRGNPPAAH